MKTILMLILLILLVTPIAAACRPDATEAHAYHLAPISQLPPDVQQAPSDVRQAYQFAFYNPDLLKQLPCTCGCVSMGHTSNYSCYVAGLDEKRLPIYDNHAITCRICVDITHDAMRLLDEGHTVAQIQAHVDATYLPMGPSTGHD